MSRIANWFRQSSLVRITLGFVLAALTLAALGWLVTGPYKNWIAGFDSNIRYTMRHIQSPMWTSLFLAFTKLGSTLYLTIGGCAAGIVFIALRWFRPVILLMITMAGQSVLHNGFKWLIARPRPPALINYGPAEGFSFPSGHALSSLCLYGLIAWIVARQLENPAIKAAILIVTAVIVFIIGMSRVYIGIHYPTDMVAGFAAGLIWLFAIISTDRRPM